MPTPWAKSDVPSHQPYMDAVASGEQPDTRGTTPKSSVYLTPTAPSPFSPLHTPLAETPTPNATPTLQNQQQFTPIHQPVYHAGPPPMVPPQHTPVFTPGPPRPQQHTPVFTPPPINQSVNGTPANMRVFSPTQEMGTIPHLRMSSVSTNQKRQGAKWTAATLKQTDGIIPGQYGTNRFCSRKGMTEYGAPRDVHGKHYHRLYVDDPTMMTREEELMASDAIIPGQYGTNRFCSRKGMTEYGAPRDVHGKHYHRLMEDEPDSRFDENTLRQSDAIIGGQYGTNRFESRKGMTEYGAPRDVKGKHYHRLLEEDSSQRHSEDTLRECDAIIGGQYGSNRFASRKLMTEYGAPRDVHGKHYHRLLEEDPNLSTHFGEDTIRQSDAIIGGQYGTNRFESRKGMTEYGAPRDVRGKHLHNIIQEDMHDFPNFSEGQLRETDGIIPGQYGSNRFASRKLMTEYGAPRDVKGKHMHRAWEEDPGFSNFSEHTLRTSDAVIPGQYGTNKFDSQKGMTKFGTPRDVAGKHMHRMDEDYNFSDNIII